MLSSDHPTLLAIRRRDRKKDRQRDRWRDRMDREIGSWIGGVIYQRREP
jgi:hypothetical protein